MPQAVYLDHNATSPLRAAALSAMLECLSEYGNPSSLHAFGRRARAAVETARKTLAGILDVGPGQVIFNSGATEGNNTILKGFAGRRVLVSAVEHPSVIEAMPNAEKIPVDDNGMLDLAALDAMLAESAVALVSVQLVNSETGVIQPIAEIAALVRQHGALIHTDAVQGFGRIPFTRASLGVDFLTLSSHKIGGPQGVGAICYAAGAPLPKLILGGGQERRQRAGTENVASIAGFGAAAETAIAGMAELQRLAAFRDVMEAHLLKNPRVTVHGAASPRVANTTCFSAAGLTSEIQLMNYDLAGIAVSSGSACSSGSVQPSSVLTAMGVTEDICKCAIRLSSGWTTTEKELEIFMRAWDKLAARM